MFTNVLKQTYNIVIFSTAPKEVQEWFETKKNSNQLADALIELVFKSIKAERNSQNFTLSNKNICAIESNIGNVVDENTFLDSLYNWQNSNDAVFKDFNVQSEEKKKMLIV